MAPTVPYSFRRAALVALLTLGVAGLGACRLTGSASTVPLSQSSAIRTPTVFLGDQTPLSAVNALGPIEKNRSNGEARAGDGAPLSLGGRTFDRGLGVSARSALEYNVGAQCRSFTAQIGVDDAAPAGSAATFTVLADGRRMIPPTVMTSGSVPQTVTADIEGVERLTLLVEPAEGAKMVPADWADAKLSGCVTYDSPIIVEPSTTTPIVITGNFRSDNPKVAAIRVNTTQPVIIRNCTLAGRGHLVASGRPGTNIRVENCRGYGLNPHSYMVSPGRFVNIEEGESLTVRGNSFRSTAGIYLLGGRVSPNTVRIVQNRALNIDGRRSDGAGGWLTPAPGDSPEKFFRVQFVQFNAVAGIADAEIAWNRVENTPGHSRVEDNINIYGSTGTPDRPIRIHHNLIRGAYSYPAAQPGYSGGGIITDGCLSRHVQIDNNTVLETSNHGISIAGGEFVSIRDNRVYSTGLLPGGDPSGGDDTGIYVRWPGNCSQRGINFGSNVIARNSIAFGQPSASDPQRRRNLYIAKASSGAPLATDTDNAALPAETCLSCDDDAAIQKAVADWEQQAAAGGLVVGYVQPE